MTSIIELIRSWCSDRPSDADTIAVRIYKNGHLVARREHRVSHIGCGVDKYDVGAYNAANNITAALLGNARRTAKMECRNSREVR